MKRLAVISLSMIFIFSCGTRKEREEKFYEKETTTECPCVDRDCDPDCNINPDCTKPKIIINNDSAASAKSNCNTKVKCPKCPAPLPPIERQFLCFPECEDGMNCTQERTTPLNLKNSKTIIDQWGQRYICYEMQL